MCVCVCVLNNSAGVKGKRRTSKWQVYDGNWATSRLPFIFSAVRKSVLAVTRMALLLGPCQVRSKRAQLLLFACMLLVCSTAHGHNLLLLLFS
jgi:hypothetical protein